jgi:conjugative relaxase-like TrwC/TraI family protein
LTISLINAIKAITGMLFINHTSNSQAAKDYFKQELAQADYYMKDGQQISGEWHGLGAKALGLEGAIDKDSFERLCDNKHPETGEQLTARMKANRRVTYDFTFDAPKSVTAAYELGGDERVRRAFQEAVRETMGEIEQAMAVRVRKSGAFHDRVTGNMVWGEFVHRTTRPLADGVPDPQLHIHAVAMNLSYDAAEGCWKAGEFSAIKRDATYYQAAFHSRLAGKLKDLGYGIEREGKSFRLSGIDEVLTDKFSRRAQLIEEEAARRGITDAKQKSELGRKTRNAKNADLTISELRAEWNKRLTEDDKAALGAALGQAKGKEITVTQALDHAIEHSFERASVVREKQLLAEALMHGVGSVGVEEIRRESANAELILKEVGGVRYATTKQVYREETDMVAFVRKGRGAYRKLSGQNAPSLDTELSSEQRDAAQKILASRDQVIGLRGGAGTGKTRMMEATIAAIRQGGHEVFTFAPSAEASRGVLRSEGFANADTVERLLTDETLRAQVKDQVVWIDEAGLLSVKDTNRLFALAKEQNCRVVLSGDRRQHTAVVRGDALRIIEEEAGLPFAELKEVRRQTNASYRAAVQAISEGDAPGKGGTKLAEGIAALDRIGAIVELGGEERYRQMANDYLEAVAERKRDGTLKTALVVAPTHREGDQITAYIRDGLRSQGRLEEKERTVTALESANWTVAQRKDSALYKPGLVVQFHQNVKGFERGEKVEVYGRSKDDVTVKRADGRTTGLRLGDAERFQVYRPAELGLAAGDVVRITQNGYGTENARTGRIARARLNNGAVHQVEGFTREGDIRFTNGFVVPKNYGHLAYGYASTSHSAQGKTVDKVFVAMGQDALAAASREQFYVSVSRGRECVKLYTDDKEAMLDAVKTSGQRLSATELLSGQAPEARPKQTRKLRDAIKQNYQVLREKGRDLIVPRPGKEQQHGNTL